MHDPSVLVRGHLLISEMITGAMLFSVVATAFIAVMFVQRGMTFPEAGGLVIEILLATAALCCALGGVGYFRTKLATLNDPTTTVPAAAALGELLRARIIGLALTETAGIIGLVLALISGKVLWTVLLAAVALGFMGTLWPQGEQIARVLHRPEDRPVEPD